MTSLRSRLRDVTRTTIYGYQVKGIRFIERHKGRVLLADDMGLGKQQPIDTRVMTPSGWRKIGTLSIGEYVMGSDGRPTRVTGVFPQGVKPSYRVNLSDGTSVEAGPEHLWTVLYRRGGRYWAPITLTTDDLRLRPKKGGKDLSKTILYVPLLSAPVRFKKQKTPLPIPPYMLGAMIANGSLSHGTPKLVYGTVDWSDVMPMLTGVELGNPKQYENTTHCSVLKSIPLVKNLGLNVLSKEKFIPKQYMRATIRERKALFWGLMDADGSISQTRNKISYHTISPQLARDVRHLVECLGGIASIRKYDRSHQDKPTDYQVRMRLPAYLPPFTISRKLNKHNPGCRSRPCRTVSSVEYVRRVESVCIRVDAKDKLYLTERCILTHNTIQSAEWLAIHPEKRPVIIVCPATLKHNWQRELLKHTGLKSYICEGRITTPEQDKAAIKQAITKVKRRKKRYPTPRAKWNAIRALRKNLKRKQAAQRAKRREAYKAEILIANYEILEAWLDFLYDLKPQVIVIDECHYIKSQKAKRTKACKRLTSGAPHILALSGTPIAGKPMEFFSVLNMIRPDLFPSYWSFGMSFCSPKKALWGGGMDFSGASNLDTLRKKLKPVMIRRLKKDVLKDLPDKSRTVTPLEITNRKEYTKAETHFLEWIKRKKGLGAFQRAARAQAIVKLNNLKILAATGKLRYAIQWINDWLEETDEKLIIFAIHKVILKALKKAFPRAVVVDGTVSSNSKRGGVSPRQSAVDRFQEDPKVRLLIGQLKAAGTGLNLTAASNVLFLEVGWTPGEHDQAEDRALRIGQKNHVTCTYLVGRKTVEERILEIIHAKDLTVRRIMDGKKTAGLNLLDMFIRKIGA